MKNRTRLILGILWAVVLIVGSVITTSVLGVTDLGTAFFIGVCFGIPAGIGGVLIAGPALY